MHIGVIGSGYLATVTSACLADFGTPVTCCDASDSSADRIYGLSEGRLGFFEKNLADVIRRNVRSGRLTYGTDLEATVRKAEVIYFAQDSCAELESMAARVAELADPGAILVILTPAPVGTTARLEAKVQKAGGGSLTVVVQPVFLTHGCAVEDFNWPDRIVLGTCSPQAVLVLKQVYRPLVMRGVPVIVTSFETAEMVREASSAFLATKIAFINELAGLCEHVHADAMDLALALGLDKKIGPRCLQPGAALGGSFAHNEIESLASLAQENKVSLRILSAAREVNRTACDNVLGKILKALHSVDGKEIGILGLAFKPNTSSVAGSASIAVARMLVTNGAHVRAYDPVALPEAREELDQLVRFCENPYAAAEGADIIVVCTGWPEFRSLDFDRIKRHLKQPIIVDTKNLLDSQRMRAMGFQYVGVGRA
jgi:UDPglucose 6-dehydrogenase